MPLFHISEEETRILIKKAENNSSCENIPHKRWHLPIQKWC